MEKEKISSGNIIDFNVLKRILQFVKPYRGRFYFLIVLTVVLGVLTPIRPLLIQYTLDNDVANGDYFGMVKIMVLIFALLIVQSVFQYVHTYLSGKIGQYVIRDIRIKLYKHLVGFRLKFLTAHPSGGW